MHRRLLSLLSVVVVLLAGCGGIDERQSQICMAALQTLVGEAAASVDSAEAMPRAARGVVLRFHTDHVPARPQVLTCRFAGGRGSGDDRDALSAVSLDGEPLSAIRLVLLRHVLGLPAPSETDADAAAAAAPAQDA